MGLIHHSDRGSQYLSIRYTERIAEAGIELSVGSVGDSYDNTLAETINCLFTAEVIHRRGTVTQFRDRRICHAGMGGRVQQPLPSRAHRGPSRPPKPRQTSTPLCEVNQWPRN